MANRKLIALLFLLLFLSVAVIAYRGIGLKSRGCDISISSESDVIQVEITDENKFRAFWGQFAECRDGHFALKDPANQEGPFKVKSVEIQITDEPCARRIVEPENKDSVLASYESTVTDGDDSARIRLQISPKLSQNPKVSSTISYLIASQLVSLQKWKTDEGGGTKLWQAPPDMDFSSSGINAYPL